MEELLELKKYTMLDKIRETSCFYFIYTKVPLTETNSKGEVFLDHLTFKIHKKKLNIKKNYWDIFYDKSIMNFKYVLKYRTVLARKHYNNSVDQKKKNVFFYLDSYFEYLENHLEDFL